MSEFETVVIDLLVVIASMDAVRLAFMLYAKFKPHFHKKSEGR